MMMMTMMPNPPSPRPLQVLLRPCLRFLVVIALLFTFTTTLNTANAQQQKPKKYEIPKTTYGGGNYGNSQSKKKLQPIGDVLFMILDKDQDGEVTMMEVKETIQMLQMLLNQSPPESNDDEDPTFNYRAMLNSFQTIAPQVFTLLDANEDGTLKHWEFKFVTTFEKSLQKGGDMKQLLRDVFAIVDVDENDEITKTEWENADLNKITETVHTLFPLRPTAEAFHTVLIKLVTSSSKPKSAEDDGSTSNEDYSLSRPLFSHIDSNRDGKLSRSEVSIAYNKAGRQFLEMTKEIKTLGPMMMMFGNMGGGGGPGRRDEF